jgi:hypothetical protein
MAESDQWLELNIGVYTPQFDLPSLFLLPSCGWTMITTPRPCLSGPTFVGMIRKGSGLACDPLAAAPPPPPCMTINRTCSQCSEEDPFVEGDSTSA